VPPAVIALRCSAPGHWLVAVLPRAQEKRGTWAARSARVSLACDPSALDRTGPDEWAATGLEASRVTHALRRLEEGDPAHPFRHAH
jgi:hypothetical protein